jgi:hypothetical protein
MRPASRMNEETCDEAKWNTLANKAAGDARKGVNDVEMYSTSRYLMCPMEESFFRKLGKIHSSQIRQAVLQSWNMNKKELYLLLRKRLVKFGYLSIEEKVTKEWQGAFRFAGEWNRYRGKTDDRFQFDKEVNQGLWLIQKGTLKLDQNTWLTLASLSFSHDAEKESPNHLFLKELFRLYLQREWRIEPRQIKEEFTLNLYGEAVRCDIGCLVKRTDKPFKGFIGEMGGVQLWKVMALLHKGYEIMVLPHWTKQKINPFIRQHLSYDFYRMRRRE